MTDFSGFRSCAPSARAAGASDRQRRDVDRYAADEVGRSRREELLVERRRAEAVRNRRRGSHSRRSAPSARRTCRSRSSRSRNNARKRPASVVVTPSKRIGVELDIGGPAVAVLVGRAVVRNAREALRARLRACAAREAADPVVGVKARSACRRGAVRGRGVVNRRAEERPDRPGLEIAGPDLEVFAPVFGADRDRQRLGEAADLELARQVEVEDRLPVAKPAGVEVALALRAERGVQRVVDVVVEAVVAAARREVGLPARDLAADADRSRIIRRAWSRSAAGSRSAVSGTKFSVFGVWFGASALQSRFARIALLPPVGGADPRGDARMSRRHRVPRPATLRVRH